MAASDGGCPRRRSPQRIATVGQHWSGYAGGLLAVSPIGLAGAVFLRGGEPGQGKGARAATRFPAADAVACCNIDAQYAIK